MAKIPAKNINWSYNSVALEDEISSITMNVNNETPEATGFSDTGPVRVEGNYDWDISVDGFFDGAASQGDATIFGQIGSGAAASAFDPTGASAGANDPNYDGNAMVSRYSISGQVGGPVTYSAAFVGSGALTRAVA